MASGRHEEADSLMMLSGSWRCLAKCWSSDDADCGGSRWEMDRFSAGGSDMVLDGVERSDVVVVWHCIVPYYCRVPIMLCVGAYFG